MIPSLKSERIKKQNIEYFQSVNVALLGWVIIISREMTFDFKFSSQEIHGKLIAFKSVTFFISVYRYKLWQLLLLCTLLYQSCFFFLFHFPENRNLDFRISFRM